MLIDQGFATDRLLWGASLAEYGLHAFMSAYQKLVRARALPFPMFPVAHLPDASEALERLVARGAVARLDDGTVGAVELCNPYAPSMDVDGVIPPSDRTSSRLVPSERPSAAPGGKSRNTAAALDARWGPVDPHTGKRNRALATDPRLGRVPSSPPTQPSDAFRDASDAYASTHPDASATHRRDASDAYASTHPDASGDASNARPSERKEEKKQENTNPRRAGDACGSDAFDASATHSARRIGDASATHRRIMGSVAEDGLFGATADTYTELVRAATKRAHSGLGAADCRDLARAMGAHTDARGEALRTWLKTTFAEFVASGTPSFGGYRPGIFLRWLDDGKPSKKPASKAATIIKQPCDPAAPWAFHLSETP